MEKITLDRRAAYQMEKLSEILTIALFGGLAIMAAVSGLVDSFKRNAANNGKSR